MDSNDLRTQGEDAERHAGVDFLDLLIILAKRKAIVFGFVMLSILAATFAASILTPQYTAVTRLLPPQQNRYNTAAIFGQLGAAGGMPSGIPGLLRNPSDMFVELLRSNAVSDFVIRRYQLQDGYHSRGAQQTRDVLAKRTKISASKEGIISIEYNDSDAQRAAAVANEYVTALERLTQSLAVTEASQRRLYFEQQLEKTNQRLSGAMQALRQFQEKTGLISDSLLGLSAQTSAKLRAEITAKELQIASMAAFATSKNPDYVRAEQELSSLRAQLTKMESGSGNKGGGVLVSATRVPATVQEYTSKLRDVQYQQTLFDLLARQYELARLDESKDATLVQVFDKAEAPEHPSFPKKKQMIIFSAFGGLVLGLAAAFLLEGLQNAISNSGTSGRLRVLRGHLGWHRKGEMK